MKTLLHIDSSPRKKQSYSRMLSKLFRDKWLKECPAYQLNYRDLNATAPPHVDLPWIDAAFTPKTDRSIQQRQALELSDFFVDEFLAADVYLLGVPMYNFGMPSVLKAYVDNIVRVGRTFLFDPDAAQPYTPLVEDKEMFVVIMTGDSGYRKGERFASMNHLEPHIRTAFGFIGVKEITFIYSGNDEFGGVKLEDSLEQAKEKIDSIFHSKKSLNGA
ncbi:FMN-dependent NADH-azoreductase [Fodinibius halophilus]|uniref:FMN dependent NADH:quinone oxidoreductase n=1 Tax=Fodinibius halophilus TaxID=1736908 RepID=A0A6M1T1D0_9BACT|nr:NAD(P)H-dependent oxidoreductase [Fodinibius halophilus]NGP87779.1 FMN-dependent NADH-azoreductase [Fodinibius halophilus]